MTIALRHLRSLFIALVALSLSAGLTFGAAAPVGSFRTTVTANDGQDAGNGDEVEAAGDQDSETDESDDTGGAAEDTGDGADNCTTDPTDPATDLTTLTHGQIVCWAAQQPTPDGYKNHGAWVSSWARGENGTQAPAKQHGKGNGKNNKPQD